MNDEAARDNAQNIAAATCDSASSSDVTLTAFSIDIKPTAAPKAVSKRLNLAVKTNIDSANNSSSATSSSQKIGTTGPQTRKLNRQRKKENIRRRVEAMAAGRLRARQARLQVGLCCHHCNLMCGTTFKNSNCDTSLQTDAPATDLQGQSTVKPSEDSNQ